MLNPEEVKGEILSYQLQHCIGYDSSKPYQLVYTWNHLSNYVNVSRTGQRQRGKSGGLDIRCRGFVLIQGRRKYYSHIVKGRPNWEIKPLSEKLARFYVDICRIACTKELGFYDEDTAANAMLYLLVGGTLADCTQSASKVFNYLITTARSGIKEFAQREHDYYQHCASDSIENMADIAIDEEEDENGNDY